MFDPRLVEFYPRNHIEIHSILAKLHEIQIKPILLIYDHNDSKCDGFAFIWALSRYALLNNVQIVLVHSQFRRRTHLFCVMKEDPAIEFAAQSCAEGIAVLPSGTFLSVESDGLQAKFHFEKTEKKEILA